MKNKIYLLSLGCARNLVDSEILLGYLKDNNYSITYNLNEAEVAILNTCAFIDEAKEESIDYIFNLVNLKKQKKLNKIIITGCFAQRYADEIKKEIPEVDGIVTFDSYANIHKAVKSVLAGDKIVWLSENPQFIYNDRMPRVHLTPRHYAYVKISEGCNHNCSFCVIPKIKGTYRSRTIDSILREIDSLLKRGTQEIILVAQDTTAYGIDIYKKFQLHKLLKEIAQLKNLTWLRVLYMQPAYFNEEILNCFEKYDNICKYVDIPIQHASHKILKLMRRQPDRKEQILKLINNLRQRITKVAIRTSLIVGFPHETAKDFEELVEFVKQVKFERLGVFRFSKERQTPAYTYNNQVPERIKKQRFNKILSLQQEIAAENNRSFLSKKIKVIVDQKSSEDDNLYLGRSQYDAPEVDGLVYIKSKNNLKAGDIVTPTIIDTYEYDLVAEEA